MGLIRRPGPSWFYLCPLPRLCLQREQGAFQLITQATFRAEAGHRGLPRPAGAECRAAVLTSDCPLIVWALEEFSFLKIFFFSLFFLISPLPPSFSSHFQLAPGGQNKRGCSKTFLACFLSRDPSSWQKKQVPLTGKRPSTITRQFFPFGGAGLLGQAGEGQRWRNKEQPRLP